MHMRRDGPTLLCLYNIQQRSWLFTVSMHKGCKNIVAKINNEVLYTFLLVLYCTVVFIQFLGLLSLKALPFRRGKNPSLSHYSLKKQSQIVASFKDEKK